MLTLIEYYITDISYIKFIILNISFPKTCKWSLVFFRLEERYHHRHRRRCLAVPRYYCWELMLLVLQHNDLYCCCLRIYPKMSMQEKSGFKG